jgi:primary-amine oxidase
VKISLFKPADYTVVNPKKKTKIGNPVSYKIVAGKTAGSLLALDDPPQIRAAFTNNQVLDPSLLLPFSFLTMVA